LGGELAQSLLGLFQSVSLGAKGSIAQAWTAGINTVSALTPVTAIKASGTIARAACITAVATARTTRAATVSGTCASPITAGDRFGSFLARSVIATHSDHGFLGHGRLRCCNGCGLRGGGC
jgi:hypothetical protein